MDQFITCRYRRPLGGSLESDTSLGWLHAFSHIHTKQMKHKLLTTFWLTAFVVGLFLPTATFAYVDGGTKQINVGESVKLEIERSTYYTVTGNWSKSSNTFFQTVRSITH